MGIPYLACMVAAATLYHLPPRVLPSIQATEGGWNGAAVRDSNGTVDLGLMQVNSLWVAPIAAHIHASEAMVHERLRADACFNISAAGAILRRDIRLAHGDLMTGIGYYHSRTPGLGVPYRGRVSDAARRLFIRP